MATAGEDGVWLFRIAIVEARSLTPTDINGWSDPFCQVHLNKKKIYKTQVFRRTLNPQWNETVTYRYCGPLDGYLRFELYDFDSITAGEKMGEVSIPLDDPMLLQSKWCLHWYRLTKFEDVPVRGCLRLKVQMFRETSPGFQPDFFTEEHKYMHPDEIADSDRRKKELELVTMVGGLTMHSNL